MIKEDLMAIRNLLQERSIKIMNGIDDDFLFSPKSEVNDLIKDIEYQPMAFIIGCLVSRQIRSELAFEVPYKIKQILGDLNIDTLSKLNYEEWTSIFINYHLHRLPRQMALTVYKGILLINNQYNGNPHNIWNDNPSSKDVVERFEQFYGVGQKISTMAANILVRDLKVPFKDKSGIDISTDIQVMKVFTRLGLITNQHAKEEAIMMGRTINPEYPGIIDFATWEIGRNYCHNNNPTCPNCYMQKVCHHVLVKKR